jgi:hypothetical protein
VFSPSSHSGNLSFSLRNVCEVRPGLLARNDESMCMHPVDMERTTAASHQVLGYRSTGTSDSETQDRVVTVPATVRTNIHQALPCGYLSSPSTHLTSMQFDYGSRDCLDFDSFARAD